MSLEKTTAIVLRVIEFSETSCIVTLMTRDYGKITAMAKGARRPKSPFEAALDVLAFCRIVFLRKSSGAMDLLTEAKLERRFRSSATSLDRLYAGYYVVELLNLLTDDADPHGELFEIAADTINAIDQQDRSVTTTETISATLGPILLNFELQALKTLGHLPMLTQCVSCGREKRTLNRVSFGMNAGGILCNRCRNGERNVISLSSHGLKYLFDKLGHDIATEPATEAQPFETVQEPPHDYHVDETTIDDPMDEVRQLLKTYLAHLIGRPPRLQKYVKTIR